MTTIKYPATCELVPTYPKESREWYAERAKTVGASEVGMILGVSPYGGLLQLVLDKRDARDGHPRIWDSEAMALGRMAEDFILRAASERLGATVVPGVPVRRGVVSATPDGLVLTEAGEVVATVEAKLDRGRNDWDEVIANGFSVVKGRDSRLAYWWQVQTQLFVTGAPRGYLAVWTVYQYHLIEIMPDAEAFQVIAEATARAMAWVGASQNPAATEADELATLARTINPAGEGPMEVVGDVAAAIEEYASLNAQIATLEKRQDEAKRIILEAHRDAAKLTTANGYRSVFSDASERVSFDAKAFGEAHPDLLPQFQKVTKVSASCRVTAPKAKKG